ncbi:MAG: hypothetical protein GEU86_02725 [Actinophytocola sp.]|nr:hypothetical protein [Actinophytocola sp.]
MLANGNHGVIRVRRLEELGVPANSTYRRCGVGGPWRRLLPGVVSLHNGPPTRRQQLAAALLYGGEDALVTGAEACRRHGLRNVPDDNDDDVHLLIPAERKLHGAGFVLVERTKRCPKPMVNDGIPLAPITRALLDTSRRMSSMDPCRALLSEAVQRRLCDCPRLTAELAKGSSRGSAIPRKVLRELAMGTHSVAEIDGSYVWDRSGLPAAEWNGKLFGPDGEYIGSPDAYVAEVGFGWEIDSVTHHAGPAGFRDTLARNARYSAAGLIVLQTLPHRLRSEPDAVIAELRAAYAAAAAQRRPPVIFRPAR